MILFRAMSSKRKSPPTKLEGGCQPTTTTTTIAHTHLANSNKKNSHLDKDNSTLFKHTESEHFTKQDKDCDIDDDDLTIDNDHNNNDDDANDNCDGVNANTISSDGFNGKSLSAYFYLFVNFK